VRSFAAFTACSRRLRRIGSMRSHDEGHWDEEEGIIGLDPWN